MCNTFICIILFDPQDYHKVRWYYSYFGVNDWPKVTKLANGVARAEPSSLLSNLVWYNHFLGARGLLLHSLFTSVQKSKVKCDDRLCSRGNGIEVQVTFIFFSNYPLLKNTNYLYVCFKKSPPQYKMRLWPVSTIARVLCCLFVLIVFDRWQLGPDKFHILILHTKGNRCLTFS